MGLTDISPIPSMIMLGLGYAVCGVVLWPSIATSVQAYEHVLEVKTKTDVHLLGTAFGFSVAALNTALTVIPMVAAQIRIQGGSFLPVEMFYAGLGISGGVVGGGLMWVDRKTGGVLQAGITFDNGSDCGGSYTVLLAQTTEPESDFEPDCNLLGLEAVVESGASVGGRSLSFVQRQTMFDPHVLGTARFSRYLPEEDPEEGVECDRISIE